jgi:hypothetical protein
MKLAVSTLFALLVAAGPITAATEKLKQLLTVPIYTNRTEGSVTIWSGDPIDLSTLDTKSWTFPEGVFHHVTDLYVDTVGSVDPFEFEVQWPEDRPSRDSRQVSL